MLHFSLYRVGQKITFQVCVSVRDDVKRHCMCQNVQFFVSNKINVLEVASLKLLHKFTDTILPLL